MDGIDHLELERRIAEHEAYVQRNARSLELDLRETIMFIVTIVLVVAMALVWRVL